MQIGTVNRVAGFPVALPVSYITFRTVVGEYLLPKIEDDAPPRR
jgi:hypothetical protein